MSVAVRRRCSWEHGCWVLRGPGRASVLVGALLLQFDGISRPPFTRWAMSWRAAGRARVPAAPGSRGAGRGRRRRTARPAGGGCGARRGWPRRGGARRARGAGRGAGAARAGGRRSPAGRACPAGGRWARTARTPSRGAPATAATASHCPPARTWPGSPPGRVRGTTLSTVFSSLRILRRLGMQGWW